MKYKLIYSSSIDEKRGYIERTIPCNHKGVAVANEESIYRSLCNDTINDGAYGLICNPNAIYRSTFYAGFKDLTVVFSGERILGFMNPDLFLKVKAKENNRNKSFQLLSQIFPADISLFPNLLATSISLNTEKIKLPEHLNLFPEYTLFMGLCVDMARGAAVSNIQDCVDAIEIANSSISGSEPKEKVREKARRLLDKYNITH